jgi:predicted HicB family RNase H-like nuclease
MSPTKKTDHFTYRVTWSAEDSEYVGMCAEFPSLSWLAATPEAGLAGIRKLVRSVVRDMQAAGEPVPTPLAEKRYSGEFRVRIPPHVDRSLAMEAAEQGVSLNRLASAKLSS